MNITDEMVLASAKAVNPIAWEMVDGNYIVSDITREETLNVVRRILAAALTPAVGERHAECPCEDDKCIFPKCICALPSTSPAVGGDGDPVSLLTDLADLNVDDATEQALREAADTIIGLKSAIRKLKAATPAVGGEPVEWHWRTLDDEGKPTSLWFVVDGPLEKFKKDMQDDSCEYRPLYAAQPASPLRGALVSVAASLAAAISILERMPKAKMAVASNTMFDQMLADYRKSLELGRATLLASPPEQPEETP